VIRNPQSITDWMEAFKFPIFEREKGKGTTTPNWT